MKKQKTEVELLTNLTQAKIDNCFSYYSNLSEEERININRKKQEVFNKLKSRHKDKIIVDYASKIICINKEMSIKLKELYGSKKRKESKKINELKKYKKEILELHKIQSLRAIANDLSSEIKDGISHTHINTFIKKVKIGEIE